MTKILTLCHIVLSKRQGLIIGIIIDMILIN